MAEAQPQRRRVLLVEFVTRERWVFDSRAFPFIKGLAESLGDEVRWLCFGATLAIHKPRPFEVELFMRIEPDAVATLARHCQELRPTHVVLSHNVAPDVREVLQGLGAQASFLATTDHCCPPGVTSLRAWISSSDDMISAPGTDRERQLAAAGDRSWSMTRTDWLLRWLGLAPDTSPLFGRYLAEAVPPDYDAIMANELASRFKPHILVVGGMTCDHCRPVSTNPYYVGLDLSGCAQDDGCAFCTWYRGPMSDLALDPVALAEEQLRRVLETTGGRGRCCGAFDLLDVRVFSHVDRLMERISALGLPPSTFYFEPRVDRALHEAKRLERALGTAARAGHSVFLYRMGAENLVDAENARFNKCLSLDQLDAGMRRLAALAEAHPGTFDFDRSLGYISCTPWTTLEMLSQTVELSIERGLDPRGIWLYTPLQLYRGAPITKLAEHDGLLAPRFEDLCMLYEPAVNNASFDSFLPWRFRDEVVGAAFALMVRFTAAALRETFPDNVFAGDALYAHLLAQVPEPGLLARPDLFAREAIAVARSVTPPVDRLALLDSALARYRAVLAAQAPRSPEGRPGADPPPAPDPRPGAQPGDERAERLRKRLASLISRRTEASRGIQADVRSVLDDARMMEFRIRLDDHAYALFLTDKSPSRPFFFQTTHYKVTFGRETPPRSAADLRRLQAFFEALDAAASREARRRPAR
jgi:hypothetical protein